MGYSAHIRVNDQGHHQDQRCMIWTVLGKWAVEMSAGPKAYLQLKDKGRPQEAFRKALWRSLSTLLQPVAFLTNWKHVAKRSTAVL
jgi:hypothetical protein